jgi:alkanesulfonate monooxygenase SsuD/methylene tetrahydromethanopterin reductase-like flavin-dependent oxidoreductase (luciferase family)
VNYGFVLPGGSPREQVDLAIAAENAGWDAVFVWEGAFGTDAWVELAAMAERTHRLRLGTMLTPLPWRRPWKVASQVNTLADLSDGRAILAVGLGAPDPVLGSAGEETDRRTRAAMLDEGIDLIKALWAGDLQYEGQHYTVDLTSRHDLASGSPAKATHKSPIWVVGAWNRPKSMRRVLRADGLLPVAMDDNGFRTTTPADIEDMLAWLRANGGSGPDFDVVMEGETPADDNDKAREIVQPWAAAGCNWWLDSRWSVTDGDAATVVRQRIEAGPPSL